MHDLIAIIALAVSVFCALKLFYGGGVSVELQNALQIVMLSGLEVCSRNGYRLCSKVAKDRMDFSILDFNAKSLYPPEETFPDMDAAIAVFATKAKLSSPS